MRILHLAYEDPQMPGAGGGSTRCLQINQRLGQRHEITAVVASYPGAAAWEADGVRWLPVGPAHHALGRLGYFPLIAREIRRHQHDLVIDEFSAPFGPGWAPLYTRRPVIGSVQWLFAAEMRTKYHLPFDVLERHGTRRYQRMIAVSEWLAGELRDRAPGATIDVIPNGIEPAAFVVRPAARGDYLLFLGRLDQAQKGTDLLLRAFAGMRSLLGENAPRLIIAGTGPDRATLETETERLGLGDTVDFAGRVEGEAKHLLLASAQAVLMPSRHETFGMVAVEAQAAGTPVVAFDVGPIGEVAGPGGAVLVPPFDIDAFATAAAALVSDPARVEALGRRGRTWVRRYDWDAIASDQEAVYGRAVAGSALD